MHDYPSIGARCSLVLSDDVTPNTKQEIQPMRIYFKSRNPSDPHVLKRIYTYIQISNYNVKYTVGKIQKQAFQQVTFC